MRRLAASSGLPLLLLAIGCASVDPLEDVNRVVYDVNEVVDDFVLGPVNDAYVFLVPEPARNAVSNFHDNASYPVTILNDFLQGKVDQGFSDLSRFVFNSTLGLAGILDVSTPLGLPEHDEDLGQTLAVWGVGEGPYLVLPLLGPTTLRDSASRGVDTLGGPLYWVESSTLGLVMAASGGVDRRSRLDRLLEIRDEEATDPYLFTREGYIRMRRFLASDGESSAGGDGGTLDEELRELEGLDDELEELDDLPIEGR